MCYKVTLTQFRNKEKENLKERWLNIYLISKLKNTLLSIKLQKSRDFCLTSLYSNPRIPGIE